MIYNYRDYRRHLENDVKATGLNNISFMSKLFDRRLKFYRSLRLTEYYTNCIHSKLGCVIAKILRLRHRILCDRFAWTIPINVFDEGLAIVHVGTIVVSGKAKIGKYCRIHVCTNIGSSLLGELSGAPTVGDFVYIGPGAKLYGPIVIGDHVAIGANAVVNKSFAKGNCSIAGIPCKVISKKGSDLIFKNILNSQNKGLLSD